ncbi:hypothetical protein AB0I49_32905 [Streptomyces sp. NPDC050617]|uniref:hypothetical protein n=1 Tax=Streptomyces sp. NPDC050617 TaxID=3154628 RepID=UPI00343F7221
MGGTGRFGGLGAAARHERPTTAQDPPAPACARTQPPGPRTVADADEPSLEAETEEPPPDTETEDPPPDTETEEPFPDTETEGPPCERRGRGGKPW